METTNMHFLTKKKIKNIAQNLLSILNIYTYLYSYCNMTKIRAFYCKLDSAFFVVRLRSHIFQRN